MENKGMIYELIGKAIGMISPIGKDKKNQQQGFMYRGIDQVYNALNPVLSELGLFFCPEVVDMRREERVNKNGTMLAFTILTVKYTVYAPDGSFVTMTVLGEGMDSGDKGCNKAMSIAMKYACFQVFCIPTEEMVDPDQESHQVAPKAPAKPEYPPEFVTACKFAAGGSTLGRIFKENRPLFDSILKTGTPEEVKQAQIILKYMTGGTL